MSLARTIHRPCFATLLAMLIVGAARSQLAHGKGTARLIVRHDRTAVRALPEAAAMVTRRCYAAEPIAVVERRGNWLRIHNGWIEARNAVSPEEGVTAFSALIGEHPTASAYACRARAWIELRRFDKAEVDAERALAIDGRYPPAWYNRGSARGGSGDLDGAIADFQKAVGLAPQFGAAYRNLALVLLLQRRHEAAIHVFDRAIANGAGDPMTLGNRAVSLFWCGRFDKAIEDLTAAIGMDDEDADLYCKRANAYGALHQNERAIADAIRAIEIDGKSAVAYIALGPALECCGRPEEALNAFSRAIELDGKLPDAYTARAILYLNRGDLEAASADADRALELAPADPKALQIHGTVLGRQGKHSEAIEELSKAIALNEYEADSYVARGTLYYFESDYRRAAQDLDAAVKRNPNNAIAHGKRAWILATSPDPAVRNGEQALASAKRACELTKHGEAQHLAQLSAAYAETGDFDSAIKYIEQAMRLLPEGTAQEERYRTFLRAYRDGRALRRDGQSEHLLL